MDKSSFSRRKVLGVTGSAVMVGLAGCSDIMDDGDGNSTEPEQQDDFTFPEGFSESGMEVSTVLSESGVMASLSSVNVEVVRSVESTQGTQESTQSGRYDAETPAFVSQITSTQQDQTSTQDYYFESGTIYIQRDTPQQDTQYQKDDYEFSAMTDYNLQALRQHIKGVNLNYQTTEQRDGQMVAVYTATTEDFTSDSLFGGELPSQRSFSGLNSGEVELTVDSMGYIRTADFTAEMANTNSEETTTINTSFTYSDFNSASVSEPSWVGQNTFEDLSVEPSVDVDFDETEGESVTVTVNSIENADIVYIAANDSLITQIQEPGETVVNASSYTVNGSVVPIEVYATREGQQPTRITEFTPTTPGETTNNTTAGN